jgi:hypothetical protein
MTGIKEKGQIIGQISFGEEGRNMISTLDGKIVEIEHDQRPEHQNSSPIKNIDRLIVKQETDLDVARYFGEIEKINREKDNEYKLFLFPEGSEIEVENYKKDGFHTVFIENHIVTKKGKDGKVHIVWSSGRFGTTNAFFNRSISDDSSERRQNNLPINHIVRKTEDQKRGIDYFDWKEIKTPEILEEKLNSKKSKK